MKIQQQCPQCGSPFANYPSQGQKYCSVLCADKAKVKAVKKQAVIHTLVCAECGITFRNKHIRQRFCSRKCGSARFKQDKNRICEQCGQSFVRADTNPDQRFCSQRCVSLYSQVAHPREKRVLPEQECEVCRKVFAPDYPGKRFCSRSCFHQTKPTARAFAALREMNQNREETAPERKVREALTALGVVFIPQHPYFWYTIDFYIPSTNTVLEVDGVYWHSKERMQKCDRARDKFMREKGLTVIRVTDAEINNTNDLLRLIEKAIKPEEASP